MSEDLIRRIDAVNELAKFLGVPARAFIHEAEKLLKDVPSAPQWIPCKDRCPEKRGTYIVSVDGCVFPANYYPGGAYDGTTTWSGYHWTDLETGILQNDPDAWCELPKPWKGGEA